MKRAVAAALLAALFAWGGQARAEDDVDSLAKSGVQALRASHPDDAIAAFEALADRGVLSADVSFDRGLSYALRVRMGSEVEGDLGRAVHAFEEARALSHGKAADEAATALEVLRSEIARRRIVRGEPAPMEQGRSLLRAISGLVREDVWGVLAAIASGGLSAALFAAWLLQSRRARVAATTAAGLASVSLVTFAAFAFVARYERLEYREGVVVKPNSHLSDARGISLAHATDVPEGAKVRVLEERPGWKHVTWGEADGWLPSERVRPLSQLP